MSNRVEMEYVGPGTKPKNIKVLPQEVPQLEKVGFWKKVSSRKKKEEVSNG